MNIETVALTAILDGGLPRLLSLGGGSLKVKLMRLGVECVGNGYARGTITGFAAAATTDGVTHKNGSAVVSFTPSGGSIVWDELEIWNAAATVLYASSNLTSPKTISSGTHDVTIRFEVGYGRQTKSLDFRRYGRPDDDAYDNTPALEQALADAYEEGAAEIDFSGGRDWHFLTALDSNNAATYRHYENVSLVGISPEYNAQHQESAGVGIDLSNTYGTRIVLGLAAGQTWWSVQRTYRFGPTRIENLSFRTTNRCNIFKLGSEGDILDSAFRGLFVRACYFSCLDAVTIQNDWLTNHAQAGYVLPTDACYAFQITRGYDIVMEHCAFRGWSGAGIRSIACDRPLFFNCRSIICQLLEDLTIVGQSNVPSIISNCYAESYPYYGVITTGGLVSDLRAEVGYNASFTPDLGAYALPAAITWTLAAGDDEIIFTGGFHAGFDATRYFRRGHIFYLSSTQEAATNIPPRKLCVYDVSAGAVKFYNHDTCSYIQSPLSGNGSHISRQYGMPLVMIGDRCALNGLSLETNVTTPLPIYAFVPGKKTVEVTGNANTTGLAESTTPENYAPVICASSAGDEGAWGGLKVASRYNAPNHPAAYFDEGPPFHANYRGPILYEGGSRQVFMPGRGVGAADNVGRDLLYRQINDPAVGLVWCYTLADSASGWVLRPITYAGVTATCRVRYYASAATTLVLFGGQGAQSTQAIAGAGWGTATLTVDGATQMLADAHGANIIVGGANLSIARVVVTQ